MFSSISQLSIRCRFRLGNGMTSSNLTARIAYYCLTADTQAFYLEELSKDPLNSETFWGLAGFAEYSVII